MIAGWIQAMCAVLDTPAVPWHQVASALTTLEYVVHMYVLQRQAPLYERTQLPPALAPFVNARDFAARQRASRAIVRWEMVTHTVRYVLTMLRIVFLANALAWTWAGRLVQHSEKGQMVAYVCVLPALFFPFEQLVHAGELYMAQRQLSPASLAPWRTHLRDFFVMLPFRVLFSLAFVVCGVAFAVYVGEMLPAYMIALGALYIAFVSFVYPRAVRPFFDQPVVLDSGALYTRARAVAAKLGLPLEHVFLATQNSSDGGAYCFGSRTFCVVVLDRLASDAEIEAVLARAMVPWTLHHPRILTLCAAVPRALWVLGMALLVRNASLGRAFGFDDVPLPVGWDLAACLVQPVVALASFAVHVVQHRLCFEADAHAVRLEPKAGSLARAIATLDVAHLLMASAYDDALYSAYERDTPTPAQRIMALAT